MNHKAFVIFVMSAFLIGCSNSNQLSSSIKTINSDEVSSVYIGSEEFLIPILPGFSKVDIQNKRTGRLFGKHLFPNPGEEELAVFELINNQSKFIRIVSVKEFARQNIRDSDFIQLKNILVDAQKMLENFASSSNMNKLLAQLGKQSDFKVKDLRLDRGRFIDTPNILGVSSSHKTSISGEPFVKVEIASAIVLLKGKLLSIQVVNTSGDSDSEWAKNKARRMATQTIGLNNGNIKVVDFKSDTYQVSAAPQRSKYITNSKRTYKLSECDMALEMYQRNAIKEKKEVLLDNAQCFSGDDYYSGDIIYRNGTLYPKDTITNNTESLDLAETPAKQYQLGIKYAEKRNMEKAKYWIKKAYESSDTIIREKAENAWNQYKLWQY